MRRNNKEYKIIIPVGDDVPYPPSYKDQQEKPTNWEQRQKIIPALAHLVVPLMPAKSMPEREGHLMVWIHPPTHPSEALGVEHMLTKQENYRAPEVLAYARLAQRLTLVSGRCEEIDE